MPGVNVPNAREARILKAAGQGAAKAKARELQRVDRPDNLWRPEPGGKLEGYYKAIKSFPSKFNPEELTSMFLIVSEGENGEALETKVMGSFDLTPKMEQIPIRSFVALTFTGMKGKMKLFDVQWGEGDIDGERLMGAPTAEDEAF